MSKVLESVLELPTDLGGLGVLEQATAALLAAAPPLEEGDVVQYNIWLAVHELCVNIIKHAYDGSEGTFRVSMALDDAPWRVEVETYDEGPHKFDPNTWAPPDLEDLPVHGLGIFLINQLMDELTYNPGDGGSTWQLVKYLPLAQDRQLAAAALPGATN